MTTVREVVRRLRATAERSRLEGMASVGIVTGRALGVSIPALRKLARELGRDHELALRLWVSGIHEARILATMVADPALVTPDEMESWVRDVDSWDLCDHACGNLWDKTPFAWGKAVEWSARNDEYVKRAAFSLVAQLAVHDKRASDREFVRLLPIIRREATDDRNEVKKAVNWALRQIGKRNERLNAKAVAAAERLRELDSRAARWIAADALRELRSEAVQRRLRSS